MTSILTRTAPAAHVRLAYGDEQLQFGDLRLPNTPPPWPVVVVVHGGFWRAQYDLEHIGHLCAALTEVGLATWSLEYRRVGQAGGGWPGTLQDVSAGARFVLDIAKEHPLDVQRVVSVGHSAGGQLALWLASETTVLRGAVALAGVSDLRHAARLGLGRGAVQDFLGGDPDEVSERYAAASPLERLPIGVPQVLVHGTADDTVPVQIAERYAEAARSVGDDVRLRTLPGVGHFELIDPLTGAFDVVRQSVEELL